MSVHRHIPVPTNTSQVIAGTRVTYLAHDFRPAYYDHEVADNDDVSDHEILMRIDCAYSRLLKRRERRKLRIQAIINGAIWLASMMTIGAIAGVLVHG